MLGLQQYIFTEIQTLTVTRNWLESFDSFIQSVTIYSVGKGPRSDVTIKISTNKKCFLYTKLLNAIKREQLKY